MASASASASGTGTGKVSAVNGKADGSGPTARPAGTTGTAASASGPTEPTAPGRTAPAAVPPPVPRVLCDVQALATLAGTPAGALWRLEESGRQLDANVVHLPPRERIGTHTEPDLDVLLLVIAGGGSLTVPGEEPRRLTEGLLTWLPHGSTRSITAGEDGVSYLTVHRRRPGMRIGRAPRE